MNFQRSALLLFLAFAVGFVGWLLIGYVQFQWSEHFPDRSAKLLIILAVLWGTPRGVLERKTFEILAGVAIMFVGIEIAFWYPWVAAEPAPALLKGCDFWHACAVLDKVAICAILGVFIGIIDGLYERRITKALVGGLLSAILGGLSVLADPVFPNAKPLFAESFQWGLSICLMYLGTDLAQFLTGRREDDKEDD